MLQDLVLGLGLLRNLQFLLVYFYLKLGDQSLLLLDLLIQN